MFWSQDKTSMKVSIRSGPVVPTMPSWQGGLRGEVPDVNQNVPLSFPVWDSQFTVPGEEYGYRNITWRMPPAIPMRYIFPQVGPADWEDLREHSPPPTSLPWESRFGKCSWLVSGILLRKGNVKVASGSGDFGFATWNTATDTNTRKTVQQLTCRLILHIWLLKQAGKLKRLILQYNFSFPHDFSHFTESIKWLIFF